MKLTNTQRDYINAMVSLKWTKLEDKKVLLNGEFQTDIHIEDVKKIVQESVEECIEFFARY